MDSEAPCSHPGSVSGAIVVGLALRWKPAPTGVEWTPSLSGRGSKSDFADAIELVDGHNDNAPKDTNA